MGDRGETGGSSQNRRGRAPVEVDDAQGNKYRAIRSPIPPALGLVANGEGATINHSMLIKPVAK